MSNVIPFGATVPAAGDSTSVVGEKIEQARRHANPEWLDLAEQAARYVAQFGPETFTVDEVWDELEDRKRRIVDQGGRCPATHELRALGPVMNKLQRAGVIERTGEWRESRRRGSQRQPRRVWRRA